VANCPEFKRTLIGEVMNDPERDVGRVAKKHGVGRSSLFRWIKAHGADAFGVQKKPGRPKDWSFTSKLKAVMETQGLSDQAMGEYLRSKGLYYSHIVQWKTEVLEEVKRDGRQKPSAEAKLLKRVRDLERQLMLKEKALNEATALLVLKKKAESIWPAPEAEESADSTDEPPASSSRKPTKREPD